MLEPSILEKLTNDHTGLVPDLLSGAASPMEVTIAIGDRARDLLATRPEESPLVVVARYWTSLVRPPALPLRGSVDPVAIDPRALPYVSIVDVVEAERRRYRYRLVGTAVAEIFGADYTGRYMDEFVPLNLQEQVQRAYDFGCDQRDAVLFSGGYVRVDGSFFSVTRIALPLADAEGETASFLTAVVREAATSQTS